jgi:hypothetical protein
MATSLVTILSWNGDVAAQDWMKSLEVVLNNDA